MIKHIRSRAQTRFLLCLWLLCIGSLSWADRPLTIASNPTDGSQRQVYEDLMDHFREQNPGLKVRLIAIEHESFKQRVQDELQQPQADADVYFWFAGERLRYLAGQGLVRNLSGWWEKNQLNNSFSSAARDVVSYQADPYALPMNYYHWGFYYKKSVFERLGLQPPKTWSEFLNAVKVLSNANLIPVALGSEAPWTLAAWFDYLNLRINGIAYHQRLTAGQESFEDERVRNVFRYWQELIEAGAFDIEHAKIDWRGALPYLYRNLAGMMLMGNFFIADVPDRIRQDIGFFPFPTIVPGMPLYEEAPMDVAMIPANARHPEDAERFLAFLAQAEVQASINNVLGKSSPNLNAPTQDRDFLPEGQTLLARSDGITQFFDRDSSPDLANAALKAFASFMAQPADRDLWLSELEQARLQLLVGAPASQ